MYTVPLGKEKTSDRFFLTLTQNYSGEVFIYDVGWWSLPDVSAQCSTTKQCKIEPRPPVTPPQPNPICKAAQV